MKMFSRILSLLVITSLGLFYAGCGGGNGEGSSPEKTQLTKLSKTWKINSATLDTNPRTTDFTNFKLTISGTYDSGKPKGPYQFSVSGSMPDPSPWPASGTWTFSGTPTDSGGTMVRYDGVSIAYVFVGSQLKLTFDCSTCDFPGARVGEVQGTWVFIFDPA